MENVVSIRRSDIRVMICSKKIKNEPSNCTFCTLSMECNAAFKMSDIVCAERIAQSYAKKGHEVLLSKCSCEYIEAGTKVQLVKTVKDRRIKMSHEDLYKIGGDNHEDSHLWKGLGCNTAS